MTVWRRAHVYKFWIQCFQRTQLTVLNRTPDQRTVAHIDGCFTAETTLHLSAITSRKAVTLWRPAIGSTRSVLGWKETIDGRCCILSIVPLRSHKVKLSAQTNSSEIGGWHNPWYFPCQGSRLNCFDQNTPTAWLAEQHDTWTSNILWTYLLKEILTKRSWAVAIRCSRHSTAALVRINGNKKSTEKSRLERKLENMYSYLIKTEKTLSNGLLKNGTRTCWPYQGKARYRHPRTEAVTFPCALVLICHLYDSIFAGLTTALVVISYEPRCCIHVCWEVFANETCQKS